MELEQIVTHNEQHKLITKKTLWAFLVLLLLLFITFYPILFRGKILLPLDQLNTMNLPYSEQYNNVSVHNHFLFDAITQYYPYKVLAREEILSGSFAYWNPYIFGGYPEYAYTHATHFDITNIILFLCEMPMAYQLQIILQLLIAGFGMYLLLRFYKVSATISLIFAAAYMMNSMFITTLLHRWILGSFCWIPYIIVMLLSYYNRRKVFYLVFSSIFLAFSFVGGSFQTSAFVTIVLFLFHVLHLMSVKHQIVPLKYMLMPVIVFFLGFALSSIMWVPSLEFLYLDIGSRASGMYRDYPILNRILSFPLLISFFIPELVGSVRAFDLTKIANLSIFEFTGFIGFVPGLFGVLGIFFLWRKKIAVRPLIILAIIGLLLSLVTPLYKYFYHRFIIVYIFSIVVVGAVALDDFIIKRGNWDNSKKWFKYPAILFGIIFIGIVILNIIISRNFGKYYLMAQKYIEANMYRGQLAAGNEVWMLGRIDKTFEHFSITSSTIYIPILLITIVFILLYLYSRKKITNHSFILKCFAVITFFQLFIFARSWLPMIDPIIYPLYPETEATRFLQTDSSKFRVLPNYDLTSSKRVFQPNILSMYKISTLSGYSSLFPKTIGNSLRGSNINPKLLGLANVKYIITNKERKLTDTSLFLVNSGAINIYQNLNWHPRAYVVYNHEVVTNDETVIKKMSDTSFVGSTVIFGENPEQPINLYDLNIKNEMEILSLESNYIKILVNTQKEGYLVLSDTYYPGWKVFVDGKEKKIMKANYIMRSVTVPEGKSVVEFHFKPLSYKIGKWITFSALFICFLIIFISLIHTKKHSDTKLNFNAREAA